MSHSVTPHPQCRWTLKSFLQSTHPEFLYPDVQAAAISFITIDPTIPATHPQTRFSVLLDKDAYSHFCLCSYPAASCIFDFSTLIRTQPYQQPSGSTCISFPPSPSDPGSLLDVEILCSYCSDLLSRRCSAVSSNKTLVS